MITWSENLQSTSDNGYYVHKIAITQRISRVVYADSWVLAMQDNPYNPNSRLNVNGNKNKAEKIINKNWKEIKIRL